jgi:hypothetical protein
MRGRSRAESYIALLRRVQALFPDVPARDGGDADPRRADGPRRGALRGALPRRGAAPAAASGRIRPVARSISGEWASSASRTGGSSKRGIASIFCRCTSSLAGSRTRRSPRSNLRPGSYVSVSHEHPSEAVLPEAEAAYPGVRRVRYAGGGPQDVVQHPADAAGVRPQSRVGPALVVRSGQSRYLQSACWQPQRSSVMPAAFLQCSLQYLPNSP